MIVKEVMSGYVQWISPEIRISEVARIMRDNRIGCVPVGENDRLIGMITDRDITCRAVADGNDLPAVTARDVMSKGMFFCFEDEGIDKAVRLMRDKEVHHLTVLIVRSAWLAWSLWATWRSEAIKRRAPRSCSSLRETR